MTSPEIKVLNINMVLLTMLIMTACGQQATLPVAAGIGPSPTLPPPNKALITTVNIAPAKGWPSNGIPVTAPGTQVAAFAKGLDHPRWLYVLPNGDVLVAETNAPPKPDDSKGIKGKIMNMVMKRAGAGVPSPNRIILLRDSNGDGIVDKKSVFIENLNSPFGMTLVGHDLYVANSDAIVKFPYIENSLSITDKGQKLAELPAGTINHHWTKNIIANKDGTKLYATIGSNSNVAENGMEAEAERATILEVDIKSGQHQVFASGLRNPVGMAWVPDTGMLWVVVNERDELGSDLVPDYLTSVKQGAFYGWPYSYYGQHVDDRVKRQDAKLVGSAIPPDYALGPHTASLGLTWSGGNKLPAEFKTGMFVGQHGSWNRKPLSGYKVIFVPFNTGKPAGEPIDVLTGFVDKDGDAFGRPVGVVIDKQGALLVADDVGNTVWRVSASQSKQ